MITLKRLAQELNVSVSTVSKALNDNPEISQKTIDRVKELAKFYNYQPNKLALNLRKQQTKTIGVILPSSLNRFFAKVLFAIEKEATRNGYNIITCISNESLKKEIESINILINGSVDGFIVALSEETQIKEDIEHLLQIKRNGIPLVLFDRVSDHIECDKVIIDDYEAIKYATTELLNQGRGNVAYISNIDDLHVGKLRKEGFIKAFEDLNIKVNKKLMLTLDIDDNNQNKLESFFKSNEEIDGVIAADNTSGIMANGLVQRLGKKVPEDISIIGFGDEQLSTLTFPQLAVINQNEENIGKRAFELIIERINNQNSSRFQTKIIPTTFCKNKSFK